MSKVDIFQYTIMHNPEKIAGCLKEVGYQPPKGYSRLSDADQVQVLSNAVAKMTNNDEDCKMKFLSMHPDLNIIEKYLNKKNASNFMSADGDGITPIDPNKPEEEEKPKIMSSKISQGLMVGGAVLVSLFLVKEILK